MKSFITISILLSSLLNAKCTGYIDDNLGIYTSDCASKMLNIPESDYNSIMAILGGFSGLVFLFFIIYIILHIGRSYRL